MNPIPRQGRCRGQGCVAAHRLSASSLEDKDVYPAHFLLCFPVRSKPSLLAPTTEIMDQKIRETVIAKLRESGLGDVLHLPGDEKYDACVASYWSLSPRLHPWAFVQPRNTEEVLKAVKAIMTTEDVKFALLGRVFRRIEPIPLHPTGCIWLEIPILITIPIEVATLLMPVLTTLSPE